MKKFAVFDIDGTLIRWQLYHTVVDRLAKEGMLGEQTADTFNKARMRWKQREDINSFSAYEMVLVKAFEKALTQIDSKVFDKIVDEVLNEYKHQTYRYTKELLKKLKSKGYFLIAISGSHHEIVAEIAKYYGFDDFIGSQYPRKQGKFTGEKIIASLMKDTLLKSIIKKHSLSLDGSYAVGDSNSDTPLLKIVENPIAFNPDQKLFKIAKKEGWKIVIERKNMIYELEKQDGRYLLAKTN